jgi:hypothetical protein
MAAMYLEGTEVTEGGVAHLAGLSHLVSLDLTGTRVTDKGCEYLQKALPNCEISR